MDRTIYQTLIKRIKNKPVTFLTGARQGGKTYLCYKIEKD